MSYVRPLPWFQCCCVSPPPGHIIYLEAIRSFSTYSYQPLACGSPTLSPNPVPPLQRVPPSSEHMNSLGHSRTLGGGQRGVYQMAHDLWKDKCNL